MRMPRPGGPCTSPTPAAHIELLKQYAADRGAAGIDGETLAAFEKDLKGNLYKIWNRMSSGSYFPPPMRLVEIPKASGGTRPLGIPTVADRVAQTVTTTVLEAEIRFRDGAGLVVDFIRSRWLAGWCRLEETSGDLPDSRRQALVRIQADPGALFGVAFYEV
jgi:hypothetical protein